MRMLFAIAFACLALTGCQSTSIDAAIQKNLPQVCTASETAHAGYLIAVGLGKVPAKTQAKVDAAWA